MKKCEFLGTIDILQRRDGGELKKRRSFMKSVGGICTRVCIKYVSEGMYEDNMTLSDIMGVTRM